MTEAEASMGLACSDDGSTLDRPIVTRSGTRARAEIDARGESRREGERSSSIVMRGELDSHPDLESDPGVDAPADDARGHAAPTAMTREAQAALRAMFERDFQFIWRVLRRLGVPPQNVDDAVQQVFCVAARKIDAIDIAKSRSFLLGTALRIAAESRRISARGREVASDALDSEPSASPTPEQMTEKKRALELFDTILDAMSFELRTVFVLFEVEGIPTDEIAPMLQLPRGTVASRLRRARDEFQAIAKRQQARAASRPLGSIRGGRP